MTYRLRAKKELGYMLLIALTILLVRGDQSLVLGQLKPCEENKANRSLVETESRKRLSIDYSSVATLKLLSRKTTYRADEIISLDLALLNSSTSQLFFCKLSDVEITLSIYDEKGQEVIATPYTTALRGASPDDYTLLSSDSIITGSYRVLSQCDNEALRAFRRSTAEFYKDIVDSRVEFHKGYFDRGLFANWGDACLLISRPGTYTFKVEIGNKYVVEVPCKSKPKTAVGSIVSNPLQITITF